jgi:hypothetical protein
MALSAVADIQRKEGSIVSHKMAAVKIFQGALVTVNAAGFLTNVVDAAGAYFAGIAVETVDNSAGAAGDKEIRVYRTGIVKLATSGAARSNVGDTVYASANDVVTFTSAANRNIVGVMVEFESATAIWVELQAGQLVAAS